MRANRLAVLLVCAMLGGVSCKTNTHAVIQGFDSALAKKGDKVSWTSYDGSDYDVTFKSSTPVCSEGNTIHVLGRATPATCTVAVDAANNTTYYLYRIVPVNSVRSATSLAANLALVVPCHTCDDLKTGGPSRSQAPAKDIGAVIYLSWSGGTGTAEAQVPCSTLPNNACSNQGQTVEWLPGNGATKWTVVFTGRTSPCSQGNNFSSDGSSGPPTCSVGPNTTPDNYPYNFTVDGNPTRGSPPSATLTIVAATPKTP